MVCRLLQNDLIIVLVFKQEKVQSGFSPFFGLMSRVEVGFNKNRGLFLIILAELLIILENF